MSNDTKEGEDTADRSKKQDFDVLEGAAGATEKANVVDADSNRATTVVDIIILPFALLQLPASVDIVTLAILGDGM